MYYQVKNPHGGDSFEQDIELDYSVNTNPLGTPPGAVAAAKAALDRADRYPDPCCRALIRAIAAYESVPERYILCGNGAAELIYAFCAAVKPKLAVELAPTFSEYASAAEAYGCRVERCLLRAENGFQPDGTFLRFLQEKKPDTVFLCNPNNPTGRRLPEELLDGIFEFCKAGGIRLFVDECFLELSGGGGDLKARLSEYPGLFLLNAFTKTWGMAGLRLGYCLSADAGLLARMSRMTPPWNVSAPAQAAGVAALEDVDFLKRTRELIQAERPRFKAGLEALGLRVCPSEANFLLFRGTEALGAALREKKIAIRDCANFPSLGPGWYRAAVRTRGENERLISAIGEVLLWR